MTKQTLGKQNTVTRNFSELDLLMHSDDDKDKHSDIITLESQNLKFNIAYNNKKYLRVSAVTVIILGLYIYTLYTIIYGPKQLRAIQ